MPPISPQDDLPVSESEAIHISLGDEAEENKTQEVREDDESRESDATDNERKNMPRRSSPMNAELLHRLKQTAQQQKRRTRHKFVDVFPKVND